MDGKDKLSSSKIDLLQEYDLVNRKIELSRKILEHIKNSPWETRKALSGTLSTFIESVKNEIGKLERPKNELSNHQSRGRQRRQRD